jgi:hypothetical protein
MDNIVNKALYKRVKEKADLIYARPGLYKSAYIQKEYQRQGGTYKGKKPDKNKGVQRWLLGEEWIEVMPYLKDNKKVKCGTTPNKTKACRPLVRINKDTPITIPELLKIHSKDKLIKLVSQKQKDMDGRVNWKSGTFKSSK